MIDDEWMMNQSESKLFWDIILNKSLCNYHKQLESKLERPLQIISQQLWFGNPGTKKKVY